MSNIKIRSYCEEDRAGLFALWSEVFPDMPAHVDPEFDLKTKLNENRDQMLVAVDGDEVVGSAMMGFDGHRGWVYYLAVKQDRRGQGVGAAIVAHLEQCARDFGAATMVINARENALLFYEKLGYEIFTDSPTLIGTIAHKLMCKQL